MKKTMLIATALLLPPFDAAVAQSVGDTEATLRLDCGAWTGAGRWARRHAPDANLARWLDEAGSKCSARGYLEYPEPLPVSQGCELVIADPVESLQLVSPGGKVHDCRHQ